MWNDTFPPSAYNVNQFGRYYFRLGLTSPTVVMIQSCAKDLSQGERGGLCGPQANCPSQPKTSDFGHYFLGRAPFYNKNDFLL